jgi:hypothetical protein
LDLLLNLPFQLLDFPSQGGHHMRQAGLDGGSLGRAQARTVGLELLGQVAAGAGQLLEGSEPGWRSEGGSIGFRLQDSGNKHGVLGIGLAPSSALSDLLSGDGNHHQTLSQEAKPVLSGAEGKV